MGENVECDTSCWDATHIFLCIQRRRGTRPERRKEKEKVYSLHTKKKEKKKQSINNHQRFLKKNLELSFAGGYEALGRCGCSRQAVRNKYTLLER